VVAAVLSLLAEGLFVGVFTGLATGLVWTLSRAMLLLDFFFFVW
jgi:hypothetical protein